MVTFANTVLSFMLAGLGALLTRANGAPNWAIFVTFWLGYLIVSAEYRILDKLREPKA